MVNTVIQYIGVKILRQHCYQLMCSVCHYFVYVFHLIKFVFFFSFLLLPEFFLVNKDIHNLRHCVTNCSRLRLSVGKANAAK